MREICLNFVIFTSFVVFISAGKSSSEDTDPTGGSAAASVSHPVSVGLNSPKYEKYSTSFYSPAAAATSANYYSPYGVYPTSNFPYGYHGNHYVPEYERNGKDFSTRASSTVPIAAPNFGYNSKERPGGGEFGGLAMASGGGGHGHGHGHGWGWGKGHGSRIDTSALGLLGLLGLLSLMSGILNSMTTTAASGMMSSTMMSSMMMGGRRRRDVVEQSNIVTPDTQSESHDQRVSRLSLMVLPHLNVIAHARDGRVPLECTHREVCMANSLFVKELGAYGRSVGNVMSSAISKLLKEADETGSIVRHISKASEAGRSGGDCLVIYPLCTALQRRSQPLPFLIPAEHLEQLRQNNRKQLPPPAH